MHASAGVRDAVTENVATRSTGTLKAEANMFCGDVSKVTEAALIPELVSSNPLLVACSSMRRRSQFSSREISANMYSFCDTLKIERPAVCVGVHSYPGLIQ